jgi:hypothetical protein
MLYLTSLENYWAGLNTEQGGLLAAFNGFLPTTQGCPKQSFEV